MSERRKDSKGRVLRTGESERKDGLYQFRYEDISGKRQTIYDRDLNELRKKEKEIQKQLDEGVSFFDGCAPLCDALDRAFSLKRKWRDFTRETMMRYLCLIKSSKLLVHYNEVSAVKIDRCTPHVLRHTFCTKCVSSDMDVKSAQYLMGYSDARTTLNIYTDNVMDKVYESMELLEKRCN